MKTRVKDFCYPSPMGGEVPAFWVEPEDSAPRVGLLFLHPASGDRHTFLPDAQELALANELGAVSLLIDAPLTRPGRKRGGFSDPEAEAQNLKQTIADLKKGLDLLSQVPGLTHLGFVGRNFGAAMGGVLAGIESRVRAYVLIAGLPSMSDFWCTSSFPLAQHARSEATEDQMKEFAKKIAPFDGSRHIGRATPANLLFQFGSQDDWIPLEVAQRYIDAAHDPKVVKWYDSDHEMAEPSVKRDYFDFLKSAFTKNQNPE